MGNGKLGNGKNDRVGKKCNENLVSRSDGNSCLGNKNGNRKMGNGEWAFISISLYSATVFSMMLCRIAFTQCIDAA